MESLFLLIDAQFFWYLSNWRNTLGVYPIPANKGSAFFRIESEYSLSPVSASRFVFTLLHALNTAARERSIAVSASDRAFLFPISINSLEKKKTSWDSSIVF